MIELQQVKSGCWTRSTEPEAAQRAEHLFIQSPLSTQDLELDNQLSFQLLPPLSASYLFIQSLVILNICLKITPNSTLLFLGPSVKQIRRAVLQIYVPHTDQSQRPSAVIQ